VRACGGAQARQATSQTISQMKAISQERFNAFCMLTRHPMAEVLAEELEWYADDGERVIATLFRDTTDNDYCYLLLARDEIGKFRCIDVACTFPTLQFAWREMKVALAREAGVSRAAGARTHGGSNTHE
jgi:hypothetical protein